MKKLSTLLIEMTKHFKPKDAVAIFDTMLESKFLTKEERQNIQEAQSSLLPQNTLETVVFMYPEESRLAQVIRWFHWHPETDVKLLNAHVESLMRQNDPDATFDLFKLSDEEFKQWCKDFPRDAYGELGERDF